MGSLQEKILVGRLKYRDKEAFGKLYDMYVDKIYRFVYFKVSNREIAEDLTSQIFLKIWQYALEGHIKRGQSLQALLYTTARNIVIDHYRSLKETVDLESVHHLADDHDIEQAIDQAAQFQEVEAALRKLKTEYQEVIVLHYLNELSIKEVADVLHKKTSAIRVTLHRALKALRG